MQNTLRKIAYDVLGHTPIMRRPNLTGRHTVFTDSMLLLIELEQISLTAQEHERDLTLIFQVDSVFFTRLCYNKIIIQEKESIY